MASSIYPPEQERQHHSINLFPSSQEKARHNTKNYSKYSLSVKSQKMMSDRGISIWNVCFLSTISVQTPALSRYAQIPIFLQIHLILDSTHPIKTKIGENRNQRASSLLILQMRQLPSESLTDLSRAVLSNTKATGRT